MLEDLLREIVKKLERPHNGECGVCGAIWENREVWHEARCPVLLAGKELAKSKAGGLFVGTVAEINQDAKTITVDPFWFRQRSRRY